ncbi:MAG TPA: transposase [Membranihabitans sp.]|nr:transposase [Membranihabitans sp.]
MSRRRFTPKMKTKVVLEALKERHSLNELAQKYELHATQISRWKQEFLSQAEGIFEKKIKTKKNEDSLEKDEMLKVIGKLKMENDFLKKSLD